METNNNNHNTLLEIFNPKTGKNTVCVHVYFAGVTPMGM